MATPVSISNSMDFKFDEYVKIRRQLIEESLSRYLSSNDPELLSKSMRYSALSGGKRLRGLLCLAAAETINLISGKQSCGKNPEAELLEIVMPSACAIEMVHAMSLIHDDLPSMDNDDLRRGKPTNHKVFGDAIALLAGDSLLMQAVETIIANTPDSVDPIVTLDVVKRLSVATGAKGMVGGQVYDLIYTGELNLPEKVTDQLVERSIDKKQSITELERANQVKKSITPDTVKNIHSKKTSALIEFSLYAGARLSKATSEQLKGIEEFGQLLGLAFQIRDDLLDITGNQESLGKTPGKDQASDKATWIKVFGIEGAEAKLLELKGSADKLLANYNLQYEKYPILSMLLDFAINRNR